MHVQSWRGQKQISVGKLLVELWKKEEANMGVMRDKTGKITGELSSKDHNQLIQIQYGDDQVSDGSLLFPFARARGDRKRRGLGVKLTNCTSSTLFLLLILVNEIITRISVRIRNVIQLFIMMRLRDCLRHSFNAYTLHCGYILS